jgi:glycosyltransferase involved in cell wall biosynthesis
VVLLAGKLSAGDARMVLGLVVRLAERGIAAEVVCVAGGGVLMPGPGVVVCPSLGSRWWRPWAVRRLGGGEAPRRPELVHALGHEVADAALALAETWRVPYVLTIDAFLPCGERLRVSRSWCRALVAVNGELADDLVRNLGIPAAMLAVVPMGIAVPEPGPDRRASGPVRVVGTAGPLAPGSGLPTFLAAARRIIDAGVDAEFIVAGQGPEEADLRRGAERLKVADRVTFTDDPTGDGAFLKVLDVFCHTAPVPTVGRALGAALAAGIPAVASDVPGLDALLPNDQTGLRVPPGDPVALADAVLALLSDPLRARRLGRRGRAWVARRFDPEGEAAALVELYRRVLDGAMPAPALPRVDTPGWAGAARAATRRS